MHILVLPRYGQLGASSRLRMYQYLPLLREAGFEVSTSPLLDDDYVRGLHTGSAPKLSILKDYWQRVCILLQIERFDVVWIEKEALPWLPEPVERFFMRKAQRVVLDYDDAVFHRYDQHQYPIVRSVLGEKLDHLMRHAHMVTVGNDYLAERAHTAECQNVQFLPTVIDLARYPSPVFRMRQGPLVVGWIGQPSTAGYLHEVASALMPLHESGLIRCVAVGARADQVRDTPFEAQTWNEDTEVAQISSFDIGIMPLPDNPWERGKCGYKLIQYMACGLPVIASPVGVNSQIVQAGVNGLLAETPEEWAEAVRALVMNEEMRLGFGGAGRRLVEKTYCLQVQSKRLITLLTDVVANTQI